MTKAKDYIPGNINDFFVFQLNLNAQVTANAVAWNIPATEATQLDALSVAFGPISQAVSNEETRTRQQLLAYKTYRKDYVAFLRPFCQSFLSNNVVIPVDVRKALGLNPRGVNPRTERTDILTAPILAMQPLGGGKVRFSFRVAASNTRTARHPESNGVMIYYKYATGSTPLPPVPPVLPTANSETTETQSFELSNSDSDNNGLPTEDGYKTFFSTRASFFSQLALSDIGRTMHVYAQWVNTSDQSKNGPFSMVGTLIIS